MHPKAATLKHPALLESAEARIKERIFSMFEYRVSCLGFVHFYGESKNTGISTDATFTVLLFVILNVEYV